MLEVEVMPVDEPYSVKWAALATEKDSVQIRDWTSREYIEPAVKSAGQGKANLYSRQNLFQIKLFSTLIESGLSREDAKKICKDFNSWSSKRPYLGLLREGKELKVRWLSEAQTQAAVIKNELDSVLIINVAKVVYSVMAKLDNFKIMPARVVISSE